jgi:hypothetical protein
MNKTIMTLVATVGITAGAFGQGAVFVDNSAVGGGISIGSSQANGQGKYFNGNLTLQVWYLNAASVPANITSDANLTTTGLTAYNNLTTDGFTLAQTYVNTSISLVNAGVITLGQLNIAGVTPAGGSPVLALVAWTSGANGNSVTPAATFAGATSGGVFSFVQPMVNYTALPAPTATALTGWSGANDLVMVPVSVPEPATLALAGLGGLASLVMLRRKQA